MATNLISPAKVVSPTVVQTGKRQSKGAVQDKQTGEVFLLFDEDKDDKIVAYITCFYLLLALALLFWQLFDLWSNSYTIPRLIGYTALDQLSAPSFRLAAYSFIGGGLGSIIDAVRSFLVWHSDRGAFGKKHIWRYVLAPWTGGTLAVIVYALLRSGTAALAGDIQVDESNIRLTLSLFGVAALAGYGARSVYKWLDFQVDNIFKTNASDKAIVPVLYGHSRSEAEQMLGAVGLKSKENNSISAQDPSLIDKVVAQDPAGSSSVDKNSTVTFSVGS